ncbi:LysR family transcriptional regulator [Burkholderia guangdongensis]|uniref:LysR family transcriptional regulator n=1 Tax=Burkholderia guangdongensis TaxID=1792500 RepID=UPI0015CC1146|nr:LysR family transcriptional regulator [Burkholderia guangdongensis]
MNDERAASRQLVGRLRFRHLKLLVVLHETGSLHGAAAQLNVTQSALSKALNEMENAFGVRLFERHARGLTATPAGALAIRGATVLLHELAHVGEQVMSEPASTILRLGAPPTVAHGLIPDILRRLIDDSTALPIRVMIQEDRADALMKSLLDGQLDAIIAPPPTELHETVAAELQHVVLHDVALVVIAPAGHPLAGAAALSWAQLQSDPWILPGQTSMVRRIVDHAFLNAGLASPTPLIESFAPYTNLQLVAKGLGLSAVPDITLAGLAGNLPVARLNVRPEPASGKVVMFYRKHGLNHGVKCLLHALGHAVR